MRTTNDASSNLHKYKDQADMRRLRAKRFLRRIILARQYYNTLSPDRRVYDENDTDTFFQKV